MKIQQLLSSDITDEYLDTLNDKYYMQYSRNSGKRHTRESQTAYIKCFDKDISNPESLILGVFDSNKLIGTATVYFDKDSLCANVGVLVFKSYASKGIAKKSLSWISAWVTARFPTYSIQVGMNKSNTAMIRSALSSGFSQIDSLDDQALLFEYKKSSNHPEHLQLVLQSEPTLFFASDTGGSEALLEVFLINRVRKSLFVCGQSQEVFRYFGIPYSDSRLVNRADFESLFFSTGSKCSILKLIQHHFTDLGLPQTCILDHWVNYKERFDSNGLDLPNRFFVTNEIAQEKAKDVFPESQIFLIPDFRLQRLNSMIKVNFPRGEDCVLVVLEPERASIEGLGEITRRSQFETIRWAKIVANQMGLGSIVLRLHPKMQKSVWVEDVLRADDSLKFSRFTRIEDDLSNTKAVVGLSSSVLYFTSKLGIPTFTVLEAAADSWLGMCREIQKSGV